MATPEDRERESRESSETKFEEIRDEQEKEVREDAHKIADVPPPKDERD